MYVRMYTLIYDQRVAIVNVTVDKHAIRRSGFRRMAGERLGGKVIFVHAPFAWPRGNEDGANCSWRWMHAANESPGWSQGAVEG
jgi:hypothetical protein